MTYTVHSIFKTIQGEGVHMGRAAVFCRFAGCNLWSGRERDRATAICKFCDTEFVGGTKYITAEDLSLATLNVWGASDVGRFVVLTGGEPALQYDPPLYRELKRLNFYIAIETNGSVPLAAAVDWKCVSPKTGSTLVELTADEMKLVYPQRVDPDDLRRAVRADYYTLSPMDGPALKSNTKLAADYVMRDPRWRLGIQAHKQWGIP